MGTWLCSVVRMRVGHGLSVLLIGKAGEPRNVIPVAGNIEVVCPASKVEEWVFLQRSFWVLPGPPVFSS